MQSLASEFSIQVQGLTRRYGSFEAVRGIDFDVHAGEIFGLLGPNGAGKTTTIEILEGLRPRTDGQVTVLGLDPGQQSLDLKQLIGVCFQQTNLYDKIRVREALELFCSFYTRTVDGERLLKRLDLWEKRDSFYTHLSGGQKQRLALALALLNDPQVLFLDEPTAGLDPQARHGIHELIEDMRREQRTVLLTTHYIEEAERLCDRVAIIDEGRIIELGTPKEIQERVLGNSLVQIRCGTPLPDGELPLWSHSEKSILSEDRTGLTLTSTRPARTLVEAVRWIDGQGIELEDVQLTRPSLEDVFIELTGRRLRE